MLIKQSTSSRVIPFFMVSSTDHIAGKTGLTPSVTISKNGGAFAAPAGAIAEVGNGWYRIAGNATDSNTVGSLLVHATGTGADPYDVTHEVVVYDIDSSTVTVGTNNDKTGYSLVAAYDAAKTAASQANVQTELNAYGALKPTNPGRTLDITATGEAGLDFDNTIGTLSKGADIIGFNDIPVGAAMTLTSAYDAAKVAAPVGAAMTLTSAYDAAKFAASQTSVNDVDTDTSAIKLVTDKLNTALELDGAVYRYTVNALEMAPAGGGGGGADPWLTLLPGAYAAGTAGNILGTNLDALVSSRLAASSYVTPPTKEVIALATRDVDNTIPAPPPNSLGAKINAAATAGDPWSTSLPGSYPTGSAGKIVGDNIDAAITTRLATSAYTEPPTAASIAAATRDVNNLTPAANSLGAAVNSAASAGDPWSTILPGSYGANTAGKIIGDRIDVLVSSRLANADYAPSPSLTAISEAVRDVDNTAPASNSLGAAVNTAATAGDPWVKPIPATYPAGSAGNLIGTRLDVSVATRATPAQVQAELGVYGPLRPTTLGRTLDVSAGGEAGIDLDNTAGSLAKGSEITGFNDIAAGTPMTLTSAYDAAKTAASQITADGTKLVTDKLNTALELDGAVYRYTTNALEQAPTGTGGGGSGVDPWNVLLPGAYAAGTAGNILGNRLDAAVTTRATQTSVDTMAGYVDTEVAAIKSKTDNLPTDPADASDIAASFTTVNGKLDTINGAVDTEIAAIKSQTDKLQFASGNDLKVTLDGEQVAMTVQAISDMTEAILKRDWTTVSGEAAYSMLNALRMLRNSWNTSTGSIVVMKEDGVGTAWSRPLVTDPAAEPIISAS